MNAKAYAILNSQFIQQLNRGIVPWFCYKQVPPQNIREIPYNGINAILLSSYNYASPFWVTAYQADERGGHIKPNQHPSIVVFWNWFRGGNAKVPVLKYYPVYNQEQAEGVGKRNPPTQRTKVRGIPEVLAKFKDKPKIKFGDENSYNIETDTVTIKKYEHGPEKMYHLFRYLVHSTCSTERNKRNKEDYETSLTDSINFTMEGLIADIGASVLMTECGVKYRPLKPKDYAHKIVELFKQDHANVFKACHAAQKAADYILDKPEDYETEHDEISNGE